VPPLLRALIVLALIAAGFVAGFRGLRLAFGPEGSKRLTGWTLVLVALLLFALAVGTMPEVEISK
jgi:hypothetical protein